MPPGIPKAGLLTRRRSRCAAGSVAAGKRCKPGRGDMGGCHGATADVRIALQNPARHALPRRLNKTLRAVCRLWWRGPGRTGLVN
jgi:hypothetical protein